MTSITPIPVPPTSAVNVQKINEDQVMPSQVQSNTGISLNTPEGLAQVNSDFTMETDPYAGHDEAVEQLEIILKDFEKREDDAGDLVVETNKVLDKIALEYPSLLNKEFDFTNTGDKIEVINHNLSKEEYNYLTVTLNANKKLVEVTDSLNIAAAANKEATSRTNTEYQKEDVAGRIHVMSVIEEEARRTDAYNELAERQGGRGDSIFPDFDYYQNNDRNLLEVIYDIPVSVNTNA